MWRGECDVRFCFRRVFLTKSLLKFGAGAGFVFSSYHTDLHDSAVSRICHISFRIVFIMLYWRRFVCFIVEPLAELPRSWHNTYSELYPVLSVRRSDERLISSDPLPHKQSER